MPTALPATFAGYGYVKGQKGYRVLLHHSHKIVTSTSVTFTDFDAGVVRRAEQLPKLYTTTADLRALLEDDSHLRDTIAGGGVEHLDIKTLPIIHPSSSQRRILEVDQQLFTCL